VEEVVQTIERLQQSFEDLSVRGLRACGSDQLQVLIALHEELERVGAAHLAGRLEDLIDKIRDDDRGSARSLMRAQASLRVFERFLTIETVESEMKQLHDLLAQADDEDELL
jgi:hypothetical protein